MQQDPAGTGPFAGACRWRTQAALEVARILVGLGDKTKLTVAGSFSIWPKPQLLSQVGRV